jgi:cyclomaltodextrin glucanotransferase
MPWMKKRAIRKARTPTAAALALLLTPVSSTSAQQNVDYRSRTIYFIVTDRFNPHTPYDPYVDPQYPDATNTVNCFATDCTTEVEYRSYWGGDIRGAIEKLDYLQRLGVSALWLTPLMENVRDYGQGNGYGTGYHGYWVQNYYRVNAHFGSWQDVRALSQELHTRGMRFIQDITLNHSNPNDTHVLGRLYQSMESDEVLIDGYDDDVDPTTGTRFYKHHQDDPRCQRLPFVADGGQSYWQLHNCLLADLSGYDQRNPTISAYLINAGKLWLANGVDDFRLDAVKFPFLAFIAKFTRAMIDRSLELKRSAPYIVGEWSNGGLGDEKSLSFADHYGAFATNILDFQLAAHLNRFIGGDFEDATQRLNAQELDQFLHARGSAFAGRDDWQSTFIDNHDQMRTLVRLQKLGVGDREQRRRMDLAMVLLMTVRGVPIIFYGDEQYLANYDDKHDTPPGYINSDNDDPYNRVGMKNWAEDTPAFKIIHALTALRQGSGAIQRGSYATIYSDPDVLVFERRDGTDTVLVAVNRGRATTVAVPGSAGLPPGTYRGVLADASDANRGSSLIVDSDTTTLTLGELSSLVVWPQSVGR